MSSAVLVSGQLRTWSQCLPTLQWACFRKMEDPHFYISCANDEQANDAYLIGKHYAPEKVHIEIVDQPAFDDADKYLPSSLHAPYTISVPPKSILAQAWQMNRVYDLAMNNGAEKHDTFIRCRPDLWMTDFILSRREKPIWENSVSSPWWGRFAGCNDRFAVMGRVAASHYFTLYSNLNMLLDLGCPLHPESLLLAQLETNGVEVHHTLNAVFSTLRLNGERRFPEIQAQEIAEYARSK